MPGFTSGALVQWSFSSPVALFTAYCAIAALEACGVPVGVLSDVVLPSPVAQEQLQSDGDSLKSRFDSALLRQGLDAAEIDQRWLWLHRSLPVVLLGWCSFWLGQCTSIFVGCELRGWPRGQTPKSSSRTRILISDYDWIH